MRVTDNGVPALSDARSFVVIVNEYFEPALGTTVVLTGQKGQVPLILFSSYAIMNLACDLLVPSERLTNLSMVPLLPQLTSATFKPVGSNRYTIGLQMKPPGPIYLDRRRHRWVEQLVANHRAHQPIRPNPALPRLGTAVAINVERSID